LTIIASVYPIVAALKKAEELLGPNNGWEATNDIQRKFVDEIIPFCPEKDIPEIEIIASRKSDEINRFLREKGFFIQIPPLKNTSSKAIKVGIASVLDMLLEWFRKGTVTSIVTEEKEKYPAVRISEEGVSFYRYPPHPYPVAVLNTKSRDSVHITMTNMAPANMFECLDMIKTLMIKSRDQSPGKTISEIMKESSDDFNRPREFSDLILPMVDIKQTEDASWLNGLYAKDNDSNEVSISHVVQQNKLKINEIGVRFKSAVAFHSTAIIARMPPPPHIINKPFLIWCLRENWPVPLFGAYVTQENWKNPGDIKAD